MMHITQRNCNVLTLKAVGSLHPWCTCKAQTATCRTAHARGLSEQGTHVSVVSVHGPQSNHRCGRVVTQGHSRPDSVHPIACCVPTMPLAHYTPTCPITVQSGGPVLRPMRNGLADWQLARGWPQAGISHVAPRRRRATCPPYAPNVTHAHLPQNARGRARAHTHTHTHTHAHTAGHKTAPQTPTAGSDYKI